VNVGELRDCVVDVDPFVGEEVDAQLNVDDTPGLEQERTERTGILICFSFVCSCSVILWRPRRLKTFCLFRQRNLLKFPTPHDQATIE
jgi:hypothetical protein